MVQVIRDEYVTNVPVRVLGENGTERVQIAGALRASDSLIASTSVPLLAGTLDPLRRKWGERHGEQGSRRRGIPTSRRARRQPAPGLRRPRASPASGPQPETPADQPVLARTIPTNKSFRRANVSETMRPVGPDEDL